MENLTLLRPSAQLAIPIIELVGDSADVFEFHEFFQVNLLDNSFENSFGTNNSLFNKLYF